MKNLALLTVIVWALSLFISPHAAFAQKDLLGPDGNAKDAYDIPDPPSPPEDSLACKKAKALLQEYGANTDHMSCAQAIKLASDLSAQIIEAELKAEKDAKSQQRSSSTPNPVPAPNPYVPAIPHGPTTAERVQNFADALRQFNAAMSAMNQHATQNELANEKLQQQGPSPDRLPQSNGSPDLRSDDQRSADAIQQNTPISVTQAAQQSVLEQLLNPAAQAGANLTGGNESSNDRGSPQAYPQPGPAPQPSGQPPTDPQPKSLIAPQIDEKLFSNIEAAKAGFNNGYVFQKSGDVALFEPTENGEIGPQAGENGENKTPLFLCLGQLTDAKLNATQSQDLANALRRAVVSTFDDPGSSALAQTYDSAVKSGRAVGNLDEPIDPSNPSPSSPSTLSMGREIYDQVIRGQETDIVVHSRGEITTANAIQRVEQQLMDDGISPQDAANRLKLVHVVSFGGAYGNRDASVWNMIGSFQRVYSDHDPVAGALGAGNISGVINAGKDQVSGGSVWDGHNWDQVYSKYLATNAGNIFSISGVFEIQYSSGAVRKISDRPPISPLTKYDH